MVVTELAPSPSTALSKKLSLMIKLARPRTWMFAVISYLIACFSGTPSTTEEILLGIAIFAILTGATNLINAYTDIEEDRVNNPIRIVWIEHLGIPNLIGGILMAYSTVIGLSLLLGLPFTIMVTIAMFDSVFYSLPPLRFKQHPLTALLAFSGAVSLPFLAGLVVAHNTLDLLNPLFLLFSLFMFAYGTVKNIPDSAGDRMAGLKTTTTVFQSHQIAVLTSTGLLLTPYVLLSYLVVSGALATKYVFNLPLMFFPLYWSYKTRRTTRRESNEKLHTYGFLYAISFFLYNLILTYPTPISILITLSVHAILYLIAKLGLDSRKETPLPILYHETNCDTVDLSRKARHC